MLYRITTENKNYKAVLDICKFQLDGYTVTYSTGYWRGKEEPSMVIEYDDQEVWGVNYDGWLPRSVKMVVNLIRNLNEQESVMVQVFNTTCWMIKEEL